MGPLDSSNDPGGQSLKESNMFGALSGASPPSPPSTPEKSAASAPEKPAEPDKAPEKATTDFVLDDYTKTMASLEKQRSAIPRPAEPKIPEKPKTQQELVTTWGALAVAFAGLASLRTRTPMTTALNAAAAAISASTKGQQEEAKQEYQKWKDNTDLAFKIADHERDAYRDLLADISQREGVASQVFTAEERARMDALTFLNKDAAMYKASLGGPEPAIELQKTRNLQKQKMEETSKTYIEGQEAKGAWDALQKNPKFIKAQKDGDQQTLQEMYTKAYQDLSPGARVRADQAIYTPERIQRIVDNVGQFKTSLTAMQKRSSVYPDILEGLNEKYPEWNETRQKTIDSIAKSYGGGTAGQRIQNLGMLMGHLQILEKLSKELPGETDVQVVNNAVNRLARELGDPSITSFDTAQNAVSQEFNNVLLRGPGAESDRERADKALQAMQSPEQRQRGIDTIKELVGSRVIAQIDQTMPWAPAWLKTDMLIPPNVHQYFTGLAPKEALPKDSTALHAKPDESTAPQTQNVSAPAATSATPPPPPGVTQGANNSARLPDGSRLFLMSNGQWSAPYALVDGKWQLKGAAAQAPADVATPPKFRDVVSPEDLPNQ